MWLCDRGDLGYWEENILVGLKSRYVMKSGTAEKKIRMTIDLTPEFYKRLEELEAAVGSGSKASLIRDALQLYEYVAKKSREGYSFSIRKGSDEKEIVFFHLEPSVQTAR